MLGTIEFVVYIGTVNMHLHRDSFVVTYSNTYANRYAWNAKKNILMEHQKTTRRHSKQRATKRSAMSIERRKEKARGKKRQQQREKRQPQSMK
jgi:hypothetical protein